MQDLEIKPGTQSGEVHTLRGLGVTHLRHGGRGDLLVHATVQTPTRLTEEQRDLLQQFAALRGEERPEGRLAPPTRASSASCATRSRRSERAGGIARGDPPALPRRRSGPRAASVGGVVTLEGDEGRHAATVVRVRPGERYLVADGAGRRVLCEAEAVDRARCVDGPRADRRAGPAAASRARAGARQGRPRRAGRRGRDRAGRRRGRAVAGGALVVVWRGERAAKSLAKWAAVVARPPSSPAEPVCRSPPPRSTSPALVARAQARPRRSCCTRRRPAAGRCRPARRGRRARRRRARGRHLAARARRPGGGGWAPVRLGTTILRSSSAGPAALAVINAAPAGADTSWFRLRAAMARRPETNHGLLEAEPG